MRYPFVLGRVTVNWLFTCVFCRWLKIENVFPLYMMLTIIKQSFKFERPLMIVLIQHQDRRNGGEHIYYDRHILHTPKPP